MATEIDIAVTTTTYDVTITAEPNEYIVNITTGGSGGVQTVTGTTVNNTDPLNPIVEVPSLTQVLTQDDVSIFIQQILEDAVVTIPLEWQVSQVYIYGEPTIGTGGIFLDKTVVFSDNATLRFCWGVQYEDGAFTKTPEPYEFTTDAIVYYNGSTITSLTIQPNDLVMLKSGGIVSPGENTWILTVTNSSNSAVATTGAVISFATPQIYNSIASPSSSNITNDLTGAIIGVVQKIYHNAGTAPTVPAGWVRRGTGTYVTSTLNIIYAEWSVGTTVEYWITQ